MRLACDPGRRAAALWNRPGGCWLGFGFGLAQARAHLLAHHMVAVTVMVDEVTPIDGRRRLRTRSGDGGRGQGENRH